MSDNNNQQPPLNMQEELGPPKADFSAPPPYELTNSNSINVHQNLRNTLDRSQEHNSQQLALTQIQLPLPLHHGKLPTYEEVQMEKSLNGELPPAFLTAHSLQPLPPLPPPNPLLANILDSNGDGGVNGNGGNGTSLTFIAIDTSDEDNLNLTNTDNGLLGSDIMFIAAFMVAFLFNWIGFLTLTCFCHTIAARYGALSGFGLSLAKWTLIVKHSTELASHENSWLWWLIMAFGFLICIRALLQYVSIKRTWRLLSTSAQERLLFFY